MNMKRASFKGFTLAEVLITLGIIGVVAAMTIPTLIANYQKTQYITQLKKVYGSFSLALEKLLMDSGCPGDFICTGFADNNIKTIGDAISSYFNVSKTCQFGSSEKCFSLTRNNYFEGNTPTGGLDSTSAYRFVTADGVSFSIGGLGSTNCANGVGAVPTDSCYEVIVDVNAAANPNKFGRDIFYFYIMKNGILSPRSYWKYSGGTGCGYQGGTYGLNCSARIMEENWEMNY